MKVAIYVPWIYQKGGIERVLVEYSKRSRHNITFFTNNYSPKTTFPEFSKLDVKELKKVPLQRTYLDLMKVSIKIINQKLPLEGYDLLMVNTSGFGEFITLKNDSKPIVCYCNTPLKVIHDKKTREAYLSKSAIKRTLFGFFENIYKIAEKEAWKKFDFVISNSEETKKRILKGNLIEEEKIKVITPGIDYNKSKASKKFKKYFLVPGRFIWHKNFELAIEAFREFSKKNKEFELILSGGLDKKNEDYFNQLKEKSKGLNVKFVLSPSDSELSKLYSESYCVLFTAINEDFGIVPLEAMSYGKPVISVNEGGPLETIIDKETGFLVKNDYIEFSKKMIQLAEDLKKTKSMGSKARKHVKKYDWNNITKSIDRLLEKISKSKTN